MIDSITRSFCLPHYVQNALSYLGEETRPKLCINNTKLRSGVLDLERNKHQLLHRITSVKTPLISLVVIAVYNIYSENRLYYENKYSSIFDSTEASYSAGYFLRSPDLQKSSFAAKISNCLQNNVVVRYYMNFLKHNF